MPISAKVSDSFSHEARGVGGGRNDELLSCEAGAKINISLDSSFSNGAQDLELYDYYSQNVVTLRGPWVWQVRIINLVRSRALSLGPCSDGVAF